MRLSIISTVCLAAVMAGACSDWPAPGRGGMAELHYRAGETVALPGDDGLGARIAAADARLTTMSGRAVATGRPALLAEARLLWVRCLREWSGGLTEDARHDMQRLEAMLKMLTAIDVESQEAMANEDTRS